MTNKLLDNKKYILYLSSVLFIVFIIVWSFNGEQLVLDVFESENLPWSEGWIQLDDDEEIVLSDISEFETIAVGDTLVLTNEIPELISDKVLFFYTKDLEVKVYVEEELLYTFAMQDKYAFLQTPGNTWNEIEIPAEYSGMTIRIELTSQFSNRYMNTLTSLYLIDSCEAKNILFMNDGFRLIMVVALLWMTLHSFTNAFIWKRKKIKDFFAALGMVSLCILLWLMGMTGILDYFLHQPIVSYLFSVMMIPAIPVAVYEFFIVVYKKKLKVLDWIGRILWIDLFLQYILQFFFGISLLTLLPLSIALYVAGSLVVFFVIIQYVVSELRNCKKVADVNQQLVSVLIIFAGAIAECLVLLAYPKRTDLIGVVGITGFVLYLVVNKLLLTRFESRTDIEKLQLEESYNNLQNTTLIQQIKAHFFFNTLNTISALCKNDPQEADEAIRLFASYMRSYMHLIQERENIPFEKELELLESTLEIEKLRFADKFTYSCDLQYMDFKLPPLSLQPIVENAILHGLRTLSQKGELIIKTSKEDNVVTVVVSDTGVGFNTEDTVRSNSVGLKNLKKRIAIMANGTVTIESKVGEGTDVIIKLPQSKREW